MENQRTVIKDVLYSCPQPPTLCKGSKCPQCKFSTILPHLPATQKLCSAEEHLFLLPIETSHPARFSHLLKTWFIILWSDVGTSVSCKAQQEPGYLHLSVCMCKGSMLIPTAENNPCWEMSWWKAKSLQPRQEKPWPW